MLFLYIFGGLFAVILIALFVPLTAHISYDDDFGAVLSYFGIRIYPKNKIEKPDIKPTVKGKPSKSKKENYFKKLIKEKGISQTVSLFSSIIRDALIPIKFFVKHLAVKKFCLNVKVTADDAAKTAIEYGVVTTAVYNLLGFLSSLFYFNFKEVNIFADYDAEDSLIFLDFKVKISPLFAIITVCRFAKVYFRYKKECLI